MPALAGMQCVQCGKSAATKPDLKGVTRLPRGWKRTDAGVRCRDCWQAAYLLRAICVPVASPVDCSWEELRNLLKPLWRQATACANRVITECYAKDVRRNGDGKMPPMPRVYLYPELRKEFPLLGSSAISSLETTCLRKYRSMRYKVVWTAEASLPTYRYPTPFPIRAHSWSLAIEDERPVVSLPIGQARLRLRLKSGPQFRRQLGQLRQIVQGDATRSEAAIYERGDALMVKLAAWLPRPAARAVGDETLTIKTGVDAFLTAFNAKEQQLWVYNGDHLRRWSAEHARRLRRWSEDAPQTNMRDAPFASRRAAAADKYRNRMDSATHQIAAMVARYAAAKSFGAVRYDDSEKGFCKDLPWHRLKTLIAEKLSAAGIAFSAN